MTRYYAFNGDADGLCALQQLRLAETQRGTLVTGVKRDITLLRRIQGQAGDHVTVLDVSLHQNRDDLIRLLESGASVRYFDHHHAGPLPPHPLLEAHIDEAADVCTSILVDRHIGGRYRAWAVVAAFGDNLVEPARAMALEAGLNAQATATLEPFRDPASFIEQSEICAKLHSGYEEDMAKARRVATRRGYGSGIVVLPNEPWARRAMGVLINELAQSRPDTALAILSPKVSGGFTVSVRVPAGSAVSAAEFCGGFETGGGRKSAGGINYLPEADLDRFAACFEARWATR